MSGMDNWMVCSRSYSVDSIGGSAVFLFCCILMKDIVYYGRSFHEAGNEEVFFCLLFFIAFLIWHVGIQPVSAAEVTLSVSPASITFSDADPDLTPSLTANSTVRVTITVTGNGNNSWRLTHLANGDLSPSIPISNVSWTVSPQPPFVNGSMSRSVAQTAAQGTGN